MAPAAVHRNRPAPDGEEVCPAAESGEKRARFNHETVTEADDYGEPLNLHSIDDDYEMVEEEYEFDSIDDYEMLEAFDGSSCCGVARARDRCTGETVGVRRVRRASEGGGDDDGCSAVREAACLTACRGHTSVLQLKSVATDENIGDMVVVTEPLVVSASTLRSRLITRPFSEAETRGLMRQLLGAAEAMHAAEVTHRDINPDNIVVGPDDGALKICGFGCATMTTTKPAAARRHVGEPEPPMGAMRYRSPEQLYGGVPRYGPDEDIWALGCVMAELLAGTPLFAADRAEDLLEQTIDLRDDIVMLGVEAFDGVLELSVAGREVLAGLLEFDSWERPTAADALKHRWFSEEDVKAESLGLPTA